MRYHFGGLRDGRAVNNIIGHNRKYRFVQFGQRCFYNIQFTLRLPSYRLIHFLRLLNISDRKQYVFKHFSFNTLFYQQAADKPRGSGNQYIFHIIIPLQNFYRHPFSQLMAAAESAGQVFKPQSRFFRKFHESPVFVIQPPNLSRQFVKTYNSPPADIISQ